MEKSLAKQDYTIAENPVIGVRQFLKIAEKTPKGHIYTRPAKGGGMWQYVTGTYVKKVLNYCFGWDWSFEVKEKIINETQAIILGRLIIHANGHDIIKEQWGRADIKCKRNTNIPMDLGNDIKAATTDALKKCASEMGIASDIYGKEEFREIKREMFLDLPKPEKKEPVKKIDNSGSSETVLDGIIAKRKELENEN